jgi:hypothetical protein
MPTSAPFGGTSRFIVPALCTARGNTLASSAGSIANAPVSVRAAESLPLLIARAIVGRDLPAAFAACANESM